MTLCENNIYEKSSELKHLSYKAGFYSPIDKATLQSSVINNEWLFKKPIQLIEVFKVKNSFICLHFLLINFTVKIHVQSTILTSELVPSITYL